MSILGRSESGRVVGSAPPHDAPKSAGWSRKARGWLARVWEAAQPAPRVRRAAGLGGAAVPLLLAVLVGRQVRSGWGVPIDMLATALLATVALLLLTVVLRLLARALFWAPRFLGWLGTASALIVFVAAGATGIPVLAAAALGVVLVACFLAGYIAIETRRELRAGSRWRQVVLTLGAVVSLALLATLAWWLAQPGSSAHLVEVATSSMATPIGVPDPSTSGPYAVRTLTYGSGSDRRRPEFGTGVALRTAPVDARPFLKDFRGWREAIRRRYWGFGAEAFPLNGRVWYPEGTGPFPLVLVVHGNHNMGEYSDPGYGWLGHLLASRGFIVVSVDENFLNITPLGGGIPNEIAARGWMLLEHLRLWRMWNANAGNPFQGRVDLARIGLIGHSRGGEAVAIAAAFNRLARYPEDARVSFDFGFAIRAIVEISPTDGQYNPGDRPVVLENVDYLTLQGGHDSDVSQFLGDRQYHRVRFTSEGDWFKASVYIYRANHGQFNTVWGREDFPPPFGWFLNLRPLLAGEEQRRIGAVCISGFMEAALRDRRAYRDLFRNRRAAPAWLAHTTYLTRYEESSFRVLADYDEDVDVTTTSAPGGVVRATGFSIWREQDAYLRRKTPRKNYAVYLGWKPGGSGTPTYTLTLPEEFARAATLDPSARLELDIAEVDEDPNPDARPGPRKDRQPRKSPLDLTVELRDRNGNVARLPLSRFGGVPLPMQTAYTKWAAMEPMFGTTPEPVFATLELPLTAFAEAAPGFVPADLQSIALAFDRSDRGVVALDRVGFAR